MDYKIYYKEDEFFCPYCGQWKKKEKMELKKERSNFRPNLQMPYGRPNLYRYDYDVYKAPICSSCMNIFTKANYKANIVFIIILIPFLCFFIYSYYKYDYAFVTLLGFFGFVSIIPLSIRYAVKRLFVSSQNKCISYHGRYYPSELYGYNPIAHYKEMIRSKEEEKEKQKTLEELNRLIEKSKANHKTIEVDLGNGQKMYLGHNVTLSKEDSFSEQEKEKGEKSDYENEDEDEDFEGCFI